MKFTTYRDRLQHAIGTVGRAVSNRSTLPILSNILLEADEQGLTLSATDLELSVRQSLEVEVQEAGRTTLPSSIFREVVGAQPGGPPLEVEANDQDHVTFRCGRSVVEVHGLPADDFPIIPPVEAAASLSVSQPLLKELINACIIAVSHDETRARLTGLLLEHKDGRLRLVATDTHRLATRSAAVPAGSGDEISGIIPNRALREVERLLGDDPEALIGIDLSGSQVQFRFPTVTIVSRLIEGEFPNYQKVIPKSHVWELTTEVASLRESVRRCAIVSREDNRKLVLHARPSGELQLQAASSKVGRADEVLEHVEVKTDDGAGESLQIAFNADYLLDVLNQLRTEQVRLELSAANQPGAIRPVGEPTGQSAGESEAAPAGAEEDDYVYVLMPMQIL